MSLIKGVRVSDSGMDGFRFSFRVVMVLLGSTIGSLFKHHLRFVSLAFAEQAIHESEPYHLVLFSFFIPLINSLLENISNVMTKTTQIIGIFKN